jgi:DNA-binding CsgD family transcriptional regulator
VKLDQTVLDQIYEAAIIPEKWSIVCDLLAAEADAYSGSVITIFNERINWISSAHMVEHMERIANSPLRLTNVRPQRHIDQSPFSFLPDTALMSEKEIEEDSIYNTFLRPLGLGWTAGDIIHEPSGHMIIFDIIRQSEKGPFTKADINRLNALRPDLARAALMSSRLAFQQAQSVARTLSLVGLPCAVIGDTGSVIAMNDEMEAMSPRISTSARDRITLSGHRADAILAQAINHIRLGLTPAQQSIPVAASADMPAFILHILPVRRNARDIFSKSAAIVVASPVGNTGPADLRVISGLFDLTATEAKVARVVAGGHSVNEAATRLAMRRETVRSHLKRIFSKTGVNTQAQLTALLSNLATPGSGGRFPGE